MNILILSANTGQGHNSCAAAIKEAFDERGHFCEIKDSLAFMSGGISDFVTKLHVWAYRNAPGAFAWGYKVSEKHPAVFGKRSPLYRFFLAGAKHLGEYIEENSFDAVIACHVFAAVMLTEAGCLVSAPLKTAFAATDYTRSPSVDQSCLDYYFIPDESLTDNFITENITYEKIYPCGIPVRREFLSSVDKSSAKEQLGIDPSRRHLIVMCGSMGCGPVEKITLKLLPLLKDRHEVSIICGTNGKLKASLEKKLSGNPLFHIYGYADNISLFMDSADLYLTKPGGISVSEAACKGLPMVFVNAVSGCEEYNCSYFIKAGGAVCRKSADEIARECVCLLDDDRRRSDMSATLLSISHENPSQKICDILTGA